jgi:hypothetical protein
MRFIICDVAEIIEKNSDKNLAMKTRGISKTIK